MEQHQEIPSAESVYNTRKESKFETLESQRNIVFEKVKTIDELNPRIRLRIAFQFYKEIISELEERGYDVTLNETYSKNIGWNSIIMISNPHFVKESRKTIPELLGIDGDLFKKGEQILKDMGLDGLIS